MFGGEGLPTRFLKFSAPLGPSARDPSVANIDQYALGPRDAFWGHHTGWVETEPGGHPMRTPTGPPARHRGWPRPEGFDCPSGNTGGNDPALPPRGAEIFKDGRMPLRHFT
jgi:hypothetical protein